jgi:hypothetical protein
MQPATAPAPAAESGKVYAIEALRNLVGALDQEYEDLLFHLPTIPALIEYRALWDTYDTEFLAGIADQIAEGDDPAPLNAFIRKYDLPWREMADRDAARQSARVADFCRALIRWADYGNRATRGIPPGLALLADDIAPPHDQPAVTAGGEAYALAADILHYHKHGRRLERATRRALAERAASILGELGEPAPEPDPLADLCEALRALFAVGIPHPDRTPPIVMVPRAQYDELCRALNAYRAAHLSPLARPAFLAGDTIRTVDLDHSSQTIAAFPGDTWEGLAMRAASVINWQEATAPADPADGWTAADTEAEIAADVCPHCGLPGFATGGCACDDPAS